MCLCALLLDLHSASLLAKVLRHTSALSPLKLKARVAVRPPAPPIMMARPVLLGLHTFAGLPPYARLALHHPTVTLPQTKACSCRRYRIYRLQETLVHPNVPASEWLWVADIQQWQWARFQLADLPRFGCDEDVESTSRTHVGRGRPFPS